MAGGRGTRIAAVASDLPKPMISVAGKPILAHQIACLAAQGFTDITLVTGYLGGVIEDYFGDGGDFGVTIDYFRETVPLGTAGALFKMADLTADFFVINGDLVFDIDFARLLEFHRAHGALATLVSHPNSHPYDSALLTTNNTGEVIAWSNKEDHRPIYKNIVNAGIHVISTRLIADAASTITGDKVDLDRDVLKPAIAGGGIFAYCTPEYIKDMGTPERYAQVTADFTAGRVAAKNLSRPQKAVFLDRDGTLNVSAGFIRTPEALVLVADAAGAVKAINDAGYLAIVVTNQPVIARGEADFDDLAAIHAKLETDLGAGGAYVDDIFLCPHHPDKGFANERAEYKVDCDCRKPKPGMLFAAAAKYHIDLAASWMVGDDDKDVAAGRAAGCKTAKISATGELGVTSDVTTDTDVTPGTGVTTGTSVTPDVTCPSLTAFVDACIR
jgi:D,D-heptose 1,7-bisphosphate phosphatase